MILLINIVVLVLIGMVAFFGVLIFINFSFTVDKFNLNLTPLPDHRSCFINAIFLSVRFFFTKNHTHNCQHLLNKLVRFFFYLNVFHIINGRTYACGKKRLFLYCSL